MVRRVRVQPETQFEIAVTKSNGCQRRADESADDKTKEDRYVLGAGPPDLWDSWSKGLGEIRTKTESRARHHVPAVFDLVWRGE